MHAIKTLLRNVAIGGAFMSGGALLSTLTAEPAVAFECNKQYCGGVSCKPTGMQRHCVEPCDNNLCEQ